MWIRLTDGAFANLDHFTTAVDGGDTLELYRWSDAEESGTLTLRGKDRRAVLEALRRAADVTMKVPSVADNVGRRWP